MPRLMSTSEWVCSLPSITTPGVTNMALPHFSMSL